MRITTKTELRDRRYVVFVNVNDLSAIMDLKLKRFGEPLVDLGGEFSGEETIPGDDTPTEVTFALPGVERRVPSGLPYQQVFDLRDSADAPVKAEVWRKTIRDRLTTLRNDLMEKEGYFLGETVETVE